MLKFLKGVVGGSGTGIKDLPYNIGDPYPSAWGSWTHFRATSKVSITTVLSLSLIRLYVCVCVHPIIVYLGFDPGKFTGFIRFKDVL